MFLMMICPCIYAIKKPVVWIPLSILLAATVVFRFTDVDLLLSKPFFISESASLKSEAHWPLRVAEPWRSLYEIGVYPAWIIGIGGLLVFLISFFWSKLKSWRD